MPIRTPSKASGFPVQGTGFRRAAEPVRRRIILALDGEEKEGKSHFALTAPGPIAVINTDIGLEGVVQKFQDTKEVWLAEHRLRPIQERIKDSTMEEVAALAGKAWEALVNDYRRAIEARVRTVIWDTATEVWELARIAKFGKLTQVMPHHYGPVNAMYRELLRAAYDSERTNLILLHKMKAEYVNDKTTGRRLRAGFGDTGFLVQVNATCWRDREAGEFVCTIMNCRQDPAMDGVELRGEMCNFPTMAAMVTGTEEEEWT